MTEEYLVAFVSHNLVNQNETEHLLSDGASPHQNAATLAIGTTSHETADRVLPIRGQITDGPLIHPFHTPSPVQQS